MKRKRWLQLAARVLRLLVSPPHTTPELVRRSYDRVAEGYDNAWTHHMRAYSLDMLDRLQPTAGSICLDLTCGTGFITDELARRTSQAVTGVDASREMLAVARRRRGSQATYIQSDIVQYLRQCPQGSFDCVTCGWGLGYLRPWAVVREATRVLRPGGRIGIIDNTLFSLSGVLWASVLAFTERPEALVHVMQVRFLPASWALAALMRAAGLAVLSTWDGAHTYRVPNGQSALDRLTATGAAAGFEFAADEENHDAVFARFAEIMEHRHRHQDGIPITHRYLGAVGQKR